jgi:hypothetical protein
MPKQSDMNWQDAESALATDVFEYITRTMANRPPFSGTHKQIKLLIYLSATWKTGQLGQDHLPNVVMAFYRVTEDWGADRECEWEAHPGKRLLSALAKNLNKYNLKYRREKVVFEIKEGGFQISSQENRIEFELIGTIADAVQYVTRNLSRAKQIEDTAIRWSSTESLYSAEDMSRFEAAISASSVKFLCVTGPVVDSAYVAALAKVGKTRSLNQLQCYRLRHPLPFMNFLICDYEDSSPSEVLFGYAQRDDQTPSETAVFRSTNPVLIKEFRSFFGALSNSRFSDPILPQARDFVSPAPYECDVIRTFSNFPQEEIKERIGACTGRIRICTVSGQSLWPVMPTIEGALGRHLEVEIALWDADSAFVAMRGEAIDPNNRHTLRSMLVHSRALFREWQEKYKTLALPECRVQGSVSMCWIEDLIFFGNYWVGDNAASGPHFLVKAASRTGQYLQKQYDRMVRK